MHVASPGFALFVVLVLAVFHAVPHRAQNGWLLLASYVFYGLWGWHLPAILFVLTVFNHVVARRARTARGWFWAGVTVDVLAVAGLRYTVGLGLGATIGVSFYVMQAISYLADVRSGALRQPAGFIEFALYLAYFPRLLLGPIERASAFLPRLDAPRVVDNDALARSVAWIVEGLVRKLVIADHLTALVPAGLFTDPSRFPPGILAWSLVAAGLALYSDFAGYTCLVRGVSVLFGIELGPNFAQPNFSRSFTEFWTRWHISLSRWLRDYIFFPLMRVLLRRDPRKWNVPSIVIPSMAAMLASGFWHGGSAGMLVWGAIHGVFLVVERIALLMRPPGPIARQPLWRQALQMIAVFILSTLALVPFSASLPATLEFWRRLPSVEGWSTPDVRIVVAMGLTLGLDAVLYRAGEQGILALPRLAQAMLLAAGVFLLLVFGAGVPRPFVYQGF